MVRSLIAVAAGLALFAGSLRAADDEAVKGLVKQFDVKQGILKVKTGDSEQTYKVVADTKIVDRDGKPLDAEAQMEQLTQGAQVTVTLQKVEGKQGPRQVVRVQVQTVRIKKKPEPKPGQKPEPKPDPKPGQKPEPKPDPKPGQKPEPKPEPKPGQKPEQKSDK
jgi:outer membrane biosynthesis protein TonB